MRLNKHSNKRMWLLFGQVARTDHYYPNVFKTKRQATKRVAVIVNEFGWVKILTADFICVLGPLLDHLPEVREGICQEGGPAQLIARGFLWARQERVLYYACTVEEGIFTCDEAGWWLAVAISINTLIETSGLALPKAVFSAGLKLAGY